MIPKDMTLAERRLLAAATTKAMSSAKLLAMVGAKTRPVIDGDTIRYAYWSLVSDHRLVRTPAGIARAPKTPEAP